MSYYLYDAKGYLSDGPSIRGWEDFLEWGVGLDPIEEMAATGTTDDLEGLVQALESHRATGSVEQTRLVMLKAALHAEDVLILSDGVGEELRVLGGPGSGNFGHAGRPGEVGGSSTGDGCGERCTSATLNAFGVKGSPIHGAGVVSGLKEAGYSLRMVDLPRKGVGLKSFIDAHPQGSFYLSSPGHAMALVDGQLTDTSERGISDRIKVQVALEVTKSSAWSSGAGTEDGDVADASIAEASSRFPRADLSVSRAQGLEPKAALYSGEFEGLRVRNDIPNTDSIGATFSDSSEYDELPGIRAVPIADLGIEDYKAADDQARVEALAEKIKASGEIAPLIVILDGSREPYVLEGNHRARALKHLGKTAVPAVVIVDHTALKTLGGPGSGNFGHAGRPGEVGGSAQGSQPSDFVQAGHIEATDLTELIRDSGVGSDYVHLLYDDNAASEIAEAFDLNTVKSSEIEVAKRKIAERSQADLHRLFGDSVVAYRGVKGTEDKGNTVSLTLRKSTAQFHAKGGEVFEFTVPVNQVYSYSDSIGYGTFDEREIVVPKSVLASTRMLGGPGSGNFGHAGRPGQVGGSAENGWSSAPAVGAGGKKWIRANQKRYENDREFRASVDAVTLLTQGATKAIVGASMADDGLPVDKLVEEVLDAPLNAVTHPIASYKNYFEGQDVEHADYVTLREAGRALNQQIESASPLDVPIYRGLIVPTYTPNQEYFKRVQEGDYTGGGGTAYIDNPALEPLTRLSTGDTFDIPGLASFTSNQDTAIAFSQGTARGQSAKYRKGESDSDMNSHIVLEVKPGAKGIPVSALSPWRQQEVISRGKFRVTEVRKTKRNSNTDLHIVLEQLS